MKDCELLAHAEFTEWLSTQGYLDLTDEDRAASEVGFHAMRSKELCDEIETLGDDKAPVSLAILAGSHIWRMGFLLGFSEADMKEGWK